MASHHEKKLARLLETYEYNVLSHQKGKPYPLGSDVLRRYRMGELQVNDVLCEVRLVPDRRFRFDFAIPSAMLAVEVQGGEIMGQWGRKGPLGGHNTAEGMRKDCQKMCLAVIEGWTVMNVTGRQVQTGEAAMWIHEAVQSRVWSIPLSSPWPLV